MPLPITIELETGKSVSIQKIEVVDFGVARFNVLFIELNIRRDYRIDAKSFEAWLATQGKTVDNFTKKDLRIYAVSHLLPVYNRLEKAKKIKDRIAELM